MKKALITGVTVQDGAYLAELLLGKGTPATEFCSTTSRPSGARFSSRARSPAPWRASSWGYCDCLYLGNPDAKRDWGHARGYVEM